MNKTTLKELRLQNKKSRAEVAQALGVTISALLNYECGIRQISLMQVLILADLYGENAEDIIKATLSTRPNDQ